MDGYDLNIERKYSGFFQDQLQGLGSIGNH